jgi:hypothetical protein
MLNSKMFNIIPLFAAKDKEIAALREQVDELQRLLLTNVSEHLASPQLKRRSPEETEPALHPRKSVRFTAPFDMAADITLKNPFTKLKGMSVSNILVYQAHEGYMFLLANNITCLINRNTRVPEGVKQVPEGFDWEAFREWHRKDMKETIHFRIRKAYLVNQQLVEWIRRHSWELGNKLNDLL